VPCACWCCSTSTDLGYTPFAVASLFIFYEVFGILTNLFGGYIGARFGLKTTLFVGLGTQLVALSMLAFAPQSWLVVAWVMASQALSGIAKDMTKMSSKSAVKLIVPEDASATLYRWVSILTGSKNALKGRRLLPRRSAADAARFPDRDASFSPHSSRTTLIADRAC
jgi:MFS family permease